MARTFKLIGGPGDGWVGRTDDIPNKIYWKVTTEPEETFKEPFFTPPVWGNGWLDIQIYEFCKITDGVLFYRPQQGVLDNDA